MILDFNSDWIFYKEDGTSKKVDLPHDAMLLEKRYASCRNAKQSGYFPGGKYRYEKEFEISKSDLDKDITVIFEGIYRNALIYINDVLVKENRYGFIDIDVDISNYVKEGKNKITVTVDNSLVPNCRWYSGSGIYRPVFLKIEEKYAPKKLFVDTLSIDPAIIEVKCDKDASIEIYDQDKLIVKGKPGVYQIDDASLWSEDNPHLYRCKASVDDSSIEVKFGIRTITCNGKEGLKINGKRVLLRGGCLHSDNGVLGACCFKDADYRKVRVMKENGFNAIRCAHNKASRYLLEACDELGMYVMDECFDGWYIPKEYHDFSRDFFLEYKDIVKKMVIRDYNHPSVIIYSLGNEVTETVQEKGIKLLKEMSDICHDIDKSRPTTCGVNVLIDVYAKMGIGIYKDKGEYKREKLEENKNYKEKLSGSNFFNYWTQKLGKIMFMMSKGKTARKVIEGFEKSVDIVGINYASSRYDQDAKRYPDRVMLGTETLVSDLPYNWSRVKRYPQLIGDFVWSAFDYLGEACMGWTYNSYKGLPLLANQGMIDITGLPLASMYFMQIVWGIRKEPYIAVHPLNHCDETPSKGSWQFTDAISSYNWSGYEEKKAQVEVYADAYKVKLLLNDEVVKTVKVKDFIAKFDMRYQPGVLKAIALDKEGNEISSSFISTGRGKARLKVRVDKEVLLNNLQDLSYLEIEFVDDTDRLLPYIEQEVKIDIDGTSISLAGFGSALDKTNEVFSSDRHTSYRGRALAVLRSSKEIGKSVVTISSDGVEPVSVIIDVKE